MNRSESVSAEFGGAAPYNANGGNGSGAAAGGNNLGFYADR